LDTIIEGLIFDFADAANEDENGWFGAPQISLDFGKSIQYRHFVIDGFLDG
jgi:hypothetical protein